MPDGLDATEFATQLLDPALSPQAFAPEDAAPTTRVNSMWHGSEVALRQLGLRPATEVRKRDLAAVVSGRHVRTGARVMPAGSAFDLVFTAPNSLSFVWSQLTAEPRAPIEDSMLGSAAVMLDHLTSDYPMVGGIRPAESFVAALVLHAVGTISATNGPIPPMLHVHCCLFGVLDENGRLVLPDKATLCNEEVLLLSDAVGEAELADRIVKIGYSVNNTAGSGNHSFEIAGVPQKLLDADFWQNTGCAVVG